MDSKDIEEHRTCNILIDAIKLFGEEMIIGHVLLLYIKKVDLLSNSYVTVKK